MALKISQSVQVLSVYVPSRDKNGKKLRNQSGWVKSVANVLARMGGGVTIMPPVKGGWVRPDGRIIWEETVIVYTYIKPDEFLSELPALRLLLHRMGRETNQGEIAVEFDGSLYRIVRFQSS